MRSNGANHAWLSIGFLFLVALAVRFAHLDALRLDWAGTSLFSMPRGDAGHHWAEAQAILHDDFFLRDRVLWKGPGYSYFLAALNVLFGPELASVRWGLALLGALNCAGLALLAQRVFPSRWALLAGFVTAFHGTLVLFDAEPLFPTLLITLQIPVLWILSEAEPKPLRLLLAGLCMGLAALVHPVYLVPGTLLTFWRARIRRRQAALFALGIVLAIAPITLQNVLQRGQAVLISWSGGINVYVGNQPGFDQSTGQSSAAWGRVLKTTLAAGIEEEQQRDAAYYRLAWQQLMHDPIAALRMLVEKTSVLLSPVETSNNLRVYEMRDDSWPLRALMGRRGWLWWPAGLWIPAALLGIRAIMKRRSTRGDASGLLWSALAWWSVGLALSILLSFNTARYRAPIVFFGSLWVVYWLQHLTVRFRAEGWRGLLYPGLGYAILLACIASLATAQRDLPAPLEWSQARQLEAVNPDAAREWYERALEKDPESAALKLAISNYFARAGDPERQIDLLESITAEPGLEPDLLALAYEGIARSQLASGHAEQARLNVYQAIALGVDDCEWRGQPYFRMGLVPATECKLRLLLAEIEIEMGGEERAAAQLAQVRELCPEAKLYAADVQRVAERIRRRE